MRCIRCHRKLTREPQDGMGPSCFAKYGKPIPATERDLFGFDVAAAAKAAMERMRIHVAGLYVEARMEVAYQFAEARRRLGIWV